MTAQSLDCFTPEGVYLLRSLAYCTLDILLEFCVTECSIFSQNTAY